MGILVGEKKIVGSGLIFCADAKNKRSYPGSGASWFDLIGSNTGTIQSSPSFSNGIFTLDGSDDYVDFGNNTSLDLTAAASYCFWFYPAAASTSRPFARDDGSSNRNWWFYAYQDGTMWFSVMSSNSNKAISHTSSWSANNWHYYVGTFDSTTGTKLYKNGSVVGTNSFTGAADNDNVSLQLGGASHKLNGKVSVASIYNRALSADEILQNFNAQRGRFGV